MVKLAEKQDFVRCTLEKSGTMCAAREEYDVCFALLDSKVASEARW